MEPSVVQAVAVVELGTGEHLCALGVDDHADVTVGLHDVVSGDFGVEEHLIAESRAATGLDGHAEGQAFVTRLLGEELCDLGDGLVGEDDRVLLLSNGNVAGERHDDLHVSADRRHHHPTWMSAGGNRRPRYAPAMAELRPEEITTHLRAVMDPELGDNIVDLGMVGDITIADGHVTISVALTIAGCPMRAQIEREVSRRIGVLDGVASVSVETTIMNADQKAAVMARARAVAKDRATDTMSATTRILAIGSGKGGVGKSSVTTNLAVALARRGLSVGILDADIWGFSIPRMTGTTGPVEAKGGKMQPIVTPCGAGELRILSMGFLADEDRAIMWRGLVLNRAVQQFVEDAAWGDLDYLLVDLPPGTGDVAMGLVKVLPRAEMLVVTTPPLAAQQVAHRAADMATRGYLPVIGVIENMSSFTCDHGTSYALFGVGGGARLAEQIGVPLLAELPLDPGMPVGGDAGTPVALGDSSMAKAFAALAERIATEIAPPLTMDGCSARLLNAIEQAVGDAP